MENFKQKKRFENIVRLSVLFFVVVVLVAVVSFVRLGKMRRKNEEYDNTIAELIAKKDSLNNSVSSKTDDYYESQVREKLGMVDGKETYIEFK